MVYTLLNDSHKTAMGLFDADSLESAQHLADNYIDKYATQLAENDPVEDGWWYYYENYEQARIANLTELKSNLHEEMTYLVQLTDKEATDFDEDCDDMDSPYGHMLYQKYSN